MIFDENKKYWYIIVKISAVAVFLTVLIMIAEIAISAFPGGLRSNEGVADIYGWLDLFERNWFMAMRNLGLINVIATTLTIPVYFALFGLHYRKAAPFAGLALILFLVSYAIFMADNVCFAMLDLSRKYAAAGADSQAALLAAGEALLAKGSSHTPGTFPGFFLSETAAILMSIVILNGQVYKKIVGILGICAFGLMLVFEVLASFFPKLFSVAMIFAGLGGVTALVWYVLLGLGMVRFLKRPDDIFKSEGIAH